MAIMRNGGGQLTIPEDGYFNRHPETFHPAGLTHGSITLGEIDVNF